MKNKQTRKVMTTLETLRRLPRVTCLSCKHSFYGGDHTARIVACPCCGLPCDTRDAK